jgi:3-oxoacyl-[acyl-carrier protein] reductase
VDLGLKDKIIMVAASSQGLGFGIAEALAHEGAKLSLGSRTESAIKESAHKLRSEHGVDARGFILDVTDADSIARWCADTIAVYGRVDGLVINGGGPPPGQFDSLDDEAWARGYELTLLSAVRMIREVLPAMKKQGRGSILAITSTSIKEPIEGLLLSNVFRSGVASLIKSLARELAGSNIRVNNIVPGRIDTERVRSLDTRSSQQQGSSIEEERERQSAAIPLGRYGTIEDFGKAAAFLLSDAASYITGATLVVDGGKTQCVW